LKEDLRIYEHPVLGSLEKKGKVHIFVNGEKIEALEGEPIATALIAAGKKVFHRTEKRNHPRGYYCAVGVCTDCIMIVNGQPNVRTCVTTVEDGMRIETQIGKGRWVGIT
jgi:predicted molibdopterin-dependent oxidoreductase YjgC